MNNWKIDWLVDSVKFNFSEIRNLIPIKWQYEKY